jgi:pimeloyl-ACP methyl ester carboxylesterase
MSQAWLAVSGAAGGALTAAAGCNWWVRRRAKPLENPIGGEARWYQWRRDARTVHRIAYGVRGAGPPILLVHSIHAAAWSYEWRRTAAALAATRHTVYALDLLGFGRSDRPATRYSPALYTALLADFLRDIVGAPATIIGSALGATYAAATAADAADRVSALVLVQPTGLTRLAANSGAWGNVMRLPLDAPLIGTALFNLLVARPVIQRRLRQSYAGRASVTEDVVATYYQAAHQPGARHAPSAFVACQLALDLRHIWPALQQPTLVVWGAHPHLTALEDLRAFRAARPASDAAVIEGAGDLPHDEASDEFVDVVTAFLSGVRQDTPVTS